MNQLVLAGNYQEFENYLRESKRSLSNTRYVFSKVGIYGLRNVEIKKVGTWYDNPAYQEESFKKFMEFNILRGYFVEADNPVFDDSITDATN